MKNVYVKNGESLNIIQVLLQHRIDIMGLEQVLQKVRNGMLSEISQEIQVGRIIYLVQNVSATWLAHMPVAAS